ncbi:hypothetical protein FRB99_001650 [Tulasnella sp. 403]|nr:hypothetical protein FRB99_001650 [Tulasnella sp. 403]
MSFNRTFPRMDLPTAADEVAEYIHRGRITHVWSLATTVFVLYDILTTLDREVHYVWMARWSYAKVIFLLNRYLAPLVCCYNLLGTFLFIKPPSFNFCLASAYTIGVSNTIVMMLVTFTIMARTWAIYERSRTVLYIMIISFPICFLPSFYFVFTEFQKGLSEYDLNQITAMFIVEGTIKLDPQEGDVMWVLTRCYLVRLPRVLVAPMVTALGYESALFAAVCYQIAKSKKVRPRSEIVNRLFHDGVGYYIVIFISLICATISCLAGTYGQAVVASQYYAGVKSMMCSHIILRLRSYFSHDSHIVDSDNKHPAPSDGDDDLKIAPYLGGRSNVSTVIHFAHPSPECSQHNVIIDIIDEDEHTPTPAVLSISVRPDDWTDAPSPRAPIRPKPFSRHHPASASCRSLESLYREGGSVTVVRGADGEGDTWDPAETEGRQMARLGDVPLPDVELVRGHSTVSPMAGMDYAPFNGPTASVTPTSCPLPEANQDTRPPSCSPPPAP